MKKFIREVTDRLKDILILAPFVILSPLIFIGILLVVLYDFVVDIFKR